MNKKRFFIMVTALMLMATVFTACGGGTKSGSSNDNQPKTEPPAQQNEAPKQEEKPKNTGPREITMYTAGGSIDETAFNDMYGDAIRKKFPDVKLNFIRNTTGSKIGDIIASNATVDIIFDSIGYQNTLREYDIQVDLTPYIKLNNLDLNKFEPTAIEFQQKIGKGKLYALPVWTASAGLFYNKDLFDNFGVPYPKDNMTWDEIYDLAVRLTRKEGGVQYVGYVTSVSHQANTNQLELKYINPETGKAQIDNDNWTNYMKSITRFFQIPGMEWTAQNATIAAMRNMFDVERIAAMYTNYSGGTPPADMNWDVVNVPHYPEAPGVGPQSYPAYLSISTLSKNPDLAFEVIQFLVSEEYQLENTRKGRATVLNNPSIIKEYGQGLDKFKGKNVASMFPTKRAPIGDYTPEDSLVATQFNAAFTDIVVNKTDVNTALRKANEEANKKIEERKAMGK